MAPPTQLQTDSYVLARDFKSASRLNYEHYLWHETLGYDLHPTINQALQSSPNTTPEIADIACGTAIWLWHAAHILPQARLTGYDISLEQCPPTQWLPSNLRIKKWDLFSEPSEDMLGAYDVVHVRLVFVVVKNEDPKPIIKNLMRLLKPGGWLQWDELDVAHSFILRAVEGTEAPIMESMMRLFAQKGAWVGKLMELTRECGLEGAELWEFQERKELARAFFDNHLAKDEEMAVERLGGRDDDGKVKDSVKKIYEESKAGVVICTPKVVCTARKIADVESAVLSNLYT